jgi:hypothetical protein
MHPKPTPTIEFHLTGHDDDHVAVYSAARTPQRASNEVIDGLLMALNDLPGSWLVYLHGAEPATHPRCREFVAELARRHHRVAFDTRGALPLPRYQALAEAAGEALARVLVRLDLIEVGRFSDFIERIGLIKQRLPERCEVVVAAPLFEETFADLARVDALCEEADIPFRYELLLENGKLARYSPEVERHIAGRVLHDADLRRELPVRGKLCHAGELYLTIDTNGDVFRCQALSPRFRLGNVAESQGFARFVGPRPCVASRCLATDTAAAGMVQTERGGIVEILRVSAEGVLGGLRPISSKVVEAVRARANK